MYPLERQREIVEIARRDGRVEVLSLASHLKVAPETIRRDLGELEGRGLIRRVHGGALPLERLGFEGTLRSRQEHFCAEKERIACAALPIALEADVIYLDEGTTGLALADVLFPERPLTVVTSSLPIAVQLAARPHLTALSLGGRVRSHSTAVVDHWAIGMLAELVVDVAFLGTNGFTLARGLSCPDAAVAAVKMQAIKSARRSILLADHSKFGSDSFAVFATVTDFTCVITDDATSRTDVDGIKRRNVEVIRA